MAVDKTLSSGSTPMLLLKLLSEKDMYGYEMIETLRQRSQEPSIRCCTVWKKRSFLPLMRGRYPERCGSTTG